MDKMFQARGALREMDALAERATPFHRMHPLCKLLMTVAYIAVVASFPKYDLSGLAVMVLYPAIAFTVAEVPAALCFYRLRMVLPVVCAVGLVNPFFDRTPLIQLGQLTVSGGTVSMVTLMMKGIFSLMAAFLLMASTKIDALCAALRKLRVPSLPVTLLLLTYRYVGLMLEEVGVMTEAYKLRAPRQKGIHISAWGSFLGQLLLRSMDRAEELYESMQLRGFHGEFYYVQVSKCKLSHGLTAAVCIGFFLLARTVDIAVLLGDLFVR